MTPDTFQRSLSRDEPPPKLGPALTGLWWAAKGNWDTAHAVVMDFDAEKDCAWVHAYLHRVEGDASNAAYWYRRAGKPVAKAPLSEEWRAIVKALVARNRRSPRA